MYGHKTIKLYRSVFPLQLLDLGNSVSRRFPPHCGYHALRQVSNRKAVRRLEVESDFLVRFPYACRAVIDICRISSTTWERDVACPSVAFSCGALDEENLGVSPLNPFLGKEGVQPLKNRILWIATVCRYRSWSVGIRRADANNERDGSPLLAAGRIGNMREFDGRSGLQHLVQLLPEWNGNGRIA